MAQPYKILTFIRTNDVETIRKVFNLLKVAVAEAKANEENKTNQTHWQFEWDILIQQVIDSSIVGGITFFATLAASGSSNLDFRAAIIAFGITFLTKLKEYRKID